MGMTILPTMNRHERRTLSHMKQLVKPFSVFQDIPFAIDLLHPRGNGQLETVVARITAYQSRTAQQRNYLRE